MWYWWVVYYNCRSLHQTQRGLSPPLPSNWKQFLFRNPFFFFSAHGCLERKAPTQVTHHSLRQLTVWNRQRLIMGTAHLTREAWMRLGEGWKKGTYQQDLSLFQVQSKRDMWTHLSDNQLKLEVMPWKKFVLAWLKLAFSNVSYLWGGWRFNDSQTTNFAVPQQVK